MEKLIELAAREGLQAEVYALDTRRTSVSHQNGTLQDVDASFRSGLGLRVLRDGCSGLAYTRNFEDRGELLRNALTSLEGGVEAAYELPATPALAEPGRYDEALESISGARMVEECARVSAQLGGRTDCEPGVFAAAVTSHLRLLNTSGADLSTRSSQFALEVEAIFPGSASAVTREFESAGFAPLPDPELDEIVELYTAAGEVVKPAGGSMPVMFLPDSTITLAWRIQSGLSAKSAHEGISPVADQVGERIFSEALNIVDDPTDARFPGSRAFDDEGVACGPFTLIEAGVLKGLYTDLNYAAKLGITPTGHGYRSAMWGGDPVTLRPSPTLTRMLILPGEQSFEELVSGMERGLLLLGVLGPHSGNIPNGDFSVGVCPALYVEGGRIVGRVKDAMVSGNIYTVLRNVSGVGDRLLPAFGGHFPAVLCEDVSVSI